MLKNFKDWKSTVVGVVTALLMFLVVIGKINSEQQSTILEWVTQLIGIIAGIYMMFFTTTDPQK